MPEIWHLEFHRESKKHILSTENWEINERKSQKVNHIDTYKYKNGMKKK